MMRLVRGILWIIIILHHDDFRLLCSIPPGVWVAQIHIHFYSYTVMSRGQVNTPQHVNGSRYWQWVSRGFLCYHLWVDFFLIGVLFSSPPSTIRSFVSVDRRETEQKTPSLPAISKLLFTAVLCPKEFWSLSHFCFHLLSFLFLLTQTLQPILVLVYMLEYTLVFSTLWSLEFFTSVLALAVLRLGFICYLLSFQYTSLEAFWRARCVLKAVCHILCGLSASAGFVKVLLFFIALLMKQSSCSGNFQLTLNLQVLRNLYST